MENIRIFYLRDKTGFPVACVASMLLRKVEGEPCLVRYAMSIYNHADRTAKAKDFPYMRERAKQLAVGRLLRARNNTRLKEIEAKDSVKTSIVQEIRDTTIRPQVKEACELWLHEANVRAFRDENVLARDLRTSTAAGFEEAERA